MKKIFGLILTVMSFLFVSPEMYTSSSAVAAVTNPQIRVEIGQVAEGGIATAITAERTRRLAMSDEDGVRIARLIR